MISSEHVVPDASTLHGWRKSSHSGGDAGDCLEVCDNYAPWRKSSHSGGDEGDCLEVSDGYTAGVPVRDSKNPHVPALVFPADGWASFVSSVKDGEFPTP